MTFLSLRLYDLTYDWFSRGERVAWFGQVNVDDIAKGICGILSNAELALLSLSVEVEPLVSLWKSSLEIMNQMSNWTDRENGKKMALDYDPYAIMDCSESRAFYLTDETKKMEMNLV